VFASSLSASFIIRGLKGKQDGDDPVLANPDPSGKWPLKWREKMFNVNCTRKTAINSQHITTEICQTIVKKIYTRCDPFEKLLASN